MPSARFESDEREALAALPLSTLPTLRFLSARLFSLYYQHLHSITDTTERLKRVEEKVDLLIESFDLQRMTQHHQSDTEVIRSIPLVHLTSLHTALLAMLEASCRSRRCS
jgi:hypothetical protein